MLRVTDSAPTESVATANGPVVPSAVGDIGVHLVDTEGARHYFEVSDVLVIPLCGEVLYSQGVMQSIGLSCTIWTTFT